MKKPDEKGLVRGGRCGLPAEVILECMITEVNESFFCVDLDGRFIFVNDHISKSTGYPMEWFAGRFYQDLFVPEDHARAREKLTTALAGEKIEAHEMAYQTIDGKRLDVEIQMVPLHQDGEIAAVIGRAAVISKRKAMEEALRQSEERYRALVETLPCGVAVIANGVTIFTNPALNRMLQLDLKSLDGNEGIKRFIAPQDRQRMMELFGERKDGHGLSAKCIVRIRRLDGSEFPAEIAVQTISLGGNKADQYVCTDLTEQYRLEAQISQSQKMEAIGRLAGGIAHDFNNLLTSVLGLASLLKTESDPEDGVHDAAELIERAAQEAALLTRQLLEFARRGKVEKRLVAVDDIVQNVFAILSRTMDRRIKLVLSTESSNALVMGDASQLQQVFMNLAVNALDAMSESGTLSVGTRTVDRIAPCSEGSFFPGDQDPTADQGPFVEISIRDTGCGIPGDIIGSIFEPFFSTKPTGRGTGMGLAVVYGIVKAHMGIIQVTENTPQGTTFRVFLPVAEDAKDPKRRSSSEIGARPKKKEVAILVVDDERIVLKSIEKMLSELDYEVFLASNGDEAVELYEEHHDLINLVILDYSMTGMNGIECFNALKKINKEIKALLATGFGEELAEKAVEEGMSGILAKPYTLKTLEEKVAGALRFSPRRL